MARRTRFPLTAFKQYLLALGISVATVEVYLGEMRRFCALLGTEDFSSLPWDTLEKALAAFHARHFNTVWTHYAAFLTAPPAPPTSNVVLLQQPQQQAQPPSITLRPVPGARSPQPSQTSGPQPSTPPPSAQGSPPQPPHFPLPLPSSAAGLVRQLVEHLYPFTASCAQSKGTVDCDITVEELSNLRVADLHVKPDGLVLAARSHDRRGTLVSRLHVILNAVVIAHLQPMMGWAYPQAGAGSWPPLTYPFLPISPGSERAMPRELLKKHLAASKKLHVTTGAIFTATGGPTAGGEQVVAGQGVGQGSMEQPTAAAMLGIPPEAFEEARLPQVRCKTNDDEAAKKNGVTICFRTDVDESGYCSACRTPEPTAFDQPPPFTPVPGPPPGGWRHAGEGEAYSTLAGLVVPDASSEKGK